MGLIRLPDVVRANLMLKAFSLWKVPIIAYVRPKVAEISNEHCVLKIRGIRRNQNHMGSMYIGALVVGADCAGGLLVFHFGKKYREQKVTLIFKDIQGNFFKRASTDVYFTCRDGKAIEDLIQSVAQSGERKNLPVRVVATAPAEFGEEPVAEIVLTLSVKAAKSVK